MSGRIGAPDSPLGIYTERWTFDVRTSDPANTEEGDWWVRGDLAPESNQLATFRFDHGDGVWDIPIYESGTSEASVYEVWTFRVNGSLGFIPLIEAGDAAFTELRFQHDGTTTAMHNAPGVAAFFDVAITGTNSPVDEGDTLSVDYLVENTGDLQDTQDIRLQDFSDAVVDTDADVQLGGGASSTGTLTWTTGDGDSGEQQVDVVSDDTVASTTVTVGSALPDSGVARWTFDNADTESGTALDSWGSNDGTINGATTGVSGLAGYDSGQAYSFDGSDDNVDTSLTLPATCSLSIWGSPDSIASSEQELMSTRAGASGGSIRTNNSNEWNPYVYDGDAGGFVSISGSASTGTPQHLVFVIDDENEIRLYINGSSVDFASIGARVIGNPVRFGERADGGENFPGDGDDPRVHDKALTGTEVSNLYNTGSIQG